MKFLLIEKTSALVLKNREIRRIEIYEKKVIVKLFSVIKFSVNDSKFIEISSSFYPRSS